MIRIACLLVVAAGCSRVADAAPTCDLRWDELDAGASAVWDLKPWTAGDTHDECPTDFDPAKLLAPKARCKAPDCVRGLLAKSTPAVLSIDGPSGSGHYVALGLAVGGGATPRYACRLASTAGWRQLSETAHKALAPLPWLKDLDGDGTVELIVWSRLSWGDAESANGLVPVTYHFDQDRLVRADALAAKLAKTVAPHFRTPLNDGANATCRAAVADALDRWGQPRP